MSDDQISIETIKQRILSDLLSQYGTVIGGDRLRKTLGFNSLDAFRQAYARQQLPIPVFSLPNRKGKFALAIDIAEWLADSRFSLKTDTKQEEKPK